MFELDKGISLERFLETGAPEELARIEVALARTSFSGGFEDAMRSIGKGTVAAFVELFCPDAAALLPYLRRIGEVNDRICVRFFPVRENEALLKNLTGVAKIPTLVVLNEVGLPEGYYVEHPAAFRERMGTLDAQGRRNLLRDFREGRCGDLIEKDLIRLLGEAG